MTIIQLVAKVKFDFDDDMITVEDHDRKRRLVAAQADDGWRVLEGPIDSPYALSQVATAETANNVLIGALRWLDESDN